MTRAWMPMMVSCACFISLTIVESNVGLIIKIVSYRNGLGRHVPQLLIFSSWWYENLLSVIGNKPSCKSTVPYKRFCRCKSKWSLEKEGASLKSSGRIDYSYFLEYPGRLSNYLNEFDAIRAPQESRLLKYKYIIEIELILQSAGDNEYSLY